MARYFRPVSNMYCNKVQKLFCKCPYSTQSPRNLFELYSKNSNWLGVYKRHPIVTEKMSQDEFEKLREEEERKRKRTNISLFLNNENTKYEQYSQRCGAIGKKLGESYLWGKDGYKHRVTLVQIEDCQVLDVQISHDDGGNDRLTQVIVGACDVTDEQYLATISRERMDWYLERDSFPKQYWSGFPVTKDALLAPGTKLTAMHFIPDQFVRVSGISIKRGFQGVMKRWGMKGQPASHGQTKTHRKMGATGGGQDPGRIFPGKRMAGHVGGKRVTLPPTKILRINTKYNVLYVKGTLPGDIGSFVKLRDGFKSKAKQAVPLFPTNFHTNSEEEDLYADYICASSHPSIEFPPHKL